MEFITTLISDYFITGVIVITLFLARQIIINSVLPWTLFIEILKQLIFRPLNFVNELAALFIIITLWPFLLLGYVTGHKEEIDDVMKKRGLK